MSIFDKFFTKFAYKFNKGYPDMNNDQDVLLLESLISETVGYKFKLKEAKKPFEYLSPEAQKLGKELIKSLNLEDDEIIANAKNRIIVYTDRPRQDIFKALADLGYEKDQITGSSAGGFRTPEGIEIIHKAQTSIGNAGLDNEDIVVRQVNEHVELYGPINVVFKGDNKTLKYEGVTEAEGVGRDTGDNKKADIRLQSSEGVIPISIKKDGPFRWSSAMKSHGDIYHKIMGDAYPSKKFPEGKRDDLKLVADKENPRLLKMINPENDLPYGRIHVINAPGLDFESMAFGSDKSIVVQRTFDDNDFTMEGDTLTIKATKVYDKVSDFEDGDVPIIQFERNASKATQKDGYTGRGITIRTVPISIKNKSTSRANNLTIDYNDLNLK